MTSEEDHADSFLCEENENALLEWVRLSLGTWKETTTFHPIGTMQLKFFNEDATDIMKDEVGETLSIIFSDRYGELVLGVTIYTYNCSLVYLVLQLSRHCRAGNI